MKFSKIFLLAGVAFAFASCSEKEEWNTTGEAVVGMAKAELTVSEAAGMFNIPFVVAGDRNAPVQVTFEVAPLEETEKLAPAIADENYLVTSKVINVSAEAASGNIEVIAVNDEKVNEKNRAFVVTIISVNGGTIDEANKTTIVTLKDPSPYEAMAGKWTMTTASGKKWNVTIHAATEDDPDYNKVLYVTGMMGYDWTVLTMPYSYNYEEGKPEVYIKAGELFAEGVNFTGLGVCNVYLYNIVGGNLAPIDMVAEVSADGKTLDFGANSFYGAVFTSSNQYAGGWFNETGVKMTR
jgi:hypothetical protein